MMYPSFVLLAWRVINLCIKRTDDRLEYIIYESNLCCSTALVVVMGSWLLALVSKLFYILLNSNSYTFCFDVGISSVKEWSINAFILTIHIPLKETDILSVLIHNEAPPLSQTTLGFISSG